MDSSHTREDIIDASVKLFSDRGYDKVSMRDIAALVGIKAASIYNHFASKRDILSSIFEFYAGELRLYQPHLKSMLAQLKTKSIQSILSNLIFYYPESIQDKMDRIIIIASQRICLDKECESFMQKNFFEPLIHAYTTLLNQAVKMGKIENLDIDSFTRVLAYYSFSAAELNRTELKANREQWRKGLALLFSMLKPPPKIIFIKAPKRRP